MKKFFWLILLVVLFMSCFDVDPGYVCVRVWKRGSKAGETEILSVGRYGVKMRATDFIFPTYKQNYVWTRDSAEGSPNDESLTFPIEGLNINIDVGIEFCVIPDKVGVIFEEYRKGLDEITDGPMRNFVRDAVLFGAKEYVNMEEFISTNQIVMLIETAQQKTMSYFSDRGIEVSKIYIVNSPRYPDSVTKAIEEKIKATQRAIQRENELREAEAEAKKQVAEAEGKSQSRLIEAQAEAKANMLKQQSYTSSLLKALWIEKWDGKLPEIFGGDNIDMLMSR